MVVSEVERLKAVKKFEKYDFNLNGSLQDILKLAADIYQTPAAFITLIDENAQWFKVNYGFEIAQMPRDTSFCTHAIMQQDTMVVADAAMDKRFANNPFVQHTPNVRFYAGAPLASADGFNIGTICVMDTAPKVIPEEKKQQLKILAKQAIHVMQLDLAYTMLDEKMKHIELQNKTLMDIAFIQSHEFRAPVAAIIGLMNIIKEEDYRSPKKYLQMMEGAITKLDEKIHLVVQSTVLAEKIGNILVV